MTTMVETGFTIESAFLSWLKSADTNILVCWDLGHEWDAQLYATIEDGPHGAHLLSGYCQRDCGVMRTRYLTSTWQPDASHNTYKYPLNYSPRDQIREGFFMDKEHRALIRREIARRMSEEIPVKRTRKAARKVTAPEFKTAS